MSILTFTRSSIIDAPADLLRDWHFEPGTFEKLCPPWEPVRIVEFPGQIQDGAMAVFEVRLGPLQRKWVALHQLTDFGFIDRQIEGPFAHWEHSHRFETIGERRSRLTDTIHYELPLGIVGQVFGNPFVVRKLDRLFRYRHRITAECLDGKDSASSTRSTGQQSPSLRDAFPHEG